MHSKSRPDLVWLTRRGFVVIPPLHTVRHDNLYRLPQGQTLAVGVLGEFQAWAQHRSCPLAIDIDADLASIVFEVIGRHRSACGQHWLLTRSDVRAIMQYDAPNECSGRGVFARRELPAQVVAVLQFLEHLMTIDANSLGDNQLGVFLLDLEQSKASLADRERALRAELARRDRKSVV